MTMLDLYPERIMLITIRAWPHRLPRLLGIRVDWRPRVLLSHGICRAHALAFRAAHKARPELTREET
jgi:hypothetical protein